ncbi:MAG: hypothetical protein H0T39_05530 [Actinobacteria bacterium]|nr:hypothetical protein [Actinomycetota bacterium]
MNGPASTIEFVNDSGTTVRVLWLNFSGNRQLYRTLAPGERYVQQTFITHPWVVLDSAGNCLGYVLSDQPSKTYVIRPAAPQGLPPAPREFTDSFSRPAEERAHSVPLAPGVSTVEVAVRWQSPRDGFAVQKLEIVRAGKVVAREIQQTTPSKLKITRRRTATSLVIRVDKLKPGALRFRVVATKVGKATKVATRVTQRRR